eukprot:CAMPEP_0119214940 /NCGR_PEP_ID=MMETSP1327-20130426/10923_1 /TAXON_ID=38833 /ORGANISM="Micromonas pusilla, Strain RCC2306" /LENGTH=75 /DNA_ID=CAMNT_0007212713 /DNA_START=340 /DNA_END=564 /DNA_ORIENTATION=+
MSYPARRRSSASWTRRPDTGALQVSDAPTIAESGVPEFRGGTSARPRRGNGSPPGRNASVCVRVHRKLPMVPIPP